MLEDIKRITEEVFGLENIEKRKRKEEYARARAVFYTVVRKLDPYLSLSKIGRFMGNRDHATVLHALSMVADYSLEYKFKKQLAEVRSRVNNESLNVFDNDVINEQHKLIENLKEIAWNIGLSLLRDLIRLK